MRINSNTRSLLLFLTVSVLSGTASVAEEPTTEPPSMEPPSHPARAKVVRVSNKTKNFWGELEGKEKRRAIEKVRLNISRVEKLQPSWDSNPIKQKLNDIEDNRFGDPSIQDLACRTPLLDLGLFQSALPLSRPFSGNDTSRHIFMVAHANAVTRNYIDQIAARTSVPKISEMRNALTLAESAFNTGDTDKADIYYDDLLKLADGSGIFELNITVLKCYQMFKSGLMFRPPRLHHQRSYIARHYEIEIDCLKSDHDFIGALDSLKLNIDPDIAEKLRSLNNKIVQNRRSESSATVQLYNRLIDLAKNSKDQTGIVEYFALNSYHTFLQHLGERDVPVETLRAELFSSWATKELGKQPLLKQSNIKAGGDWAKLEAVLTELEKQSIYVCRSVEYCPSWGTSDLSTIMLTAPNPDAGMVYYLSERYEGVTQRGKLKRETKSSNLWLKCAEASSKETVCTDCGSRRLSQNHNGERPVKRLALKLLRESGFRAVPDNVDGVRVPGNWLPSKTITSKNSN